MKRFVFLMLTFATMALAFQNCSSPGFSEAEQLVAESQTEEPSIQPGAPAPSPGPAPAPLPVLPVPADPLPRFSNCSAGALAKGAGAGTPVQDATLLRDLRGTHDLEVLADHQLPASGADLAFYVYVNGARIGQSTDYYNAFTNHVIPRVAASKEVCVIVVERDDGGAAGVAHKDRMPIECVMEENSSVYGKRISVVLEPNSSGVSAILCMTGTGASTDDVTATKFKNSHAVFAIIPR